MNPHWGKNIENKKPPAQGLKETLKLSGICLGASICISNGRDLSERFH